MLRLRKFRRHLAREDFLSFNLGANLDDYILPGWNLIPKVHKLTEKAGVAMEPLLGTLVLSHFVITLVALCNKKVVALCNNRPSYFVIKKAVALCNNTCRTL